MPKIAAREAQLRELLQKSGSGLAKPGRQSFGGGPRQGGQAGGEDSNRLWTCGRVGFAEGGAEPASVALDPRASQASQGGDGQDQPVGAEQLCVDGFDRHAASAIAVCASCSAGWAQESCGGARLTTGRSQAQGQPAVARSGNAHARYTHECRRARSSWRSHYAGRRFACSSGTGAWELDSRRWRRPQSTRRIAVGEWAWPIGVVAKHRVWLPPGLEGFEGEGGEGEEGEEKDDTPYCFCQRVSFGEMIGCDNAENDPDCKEWFHIGCVGVTKPLPQKWYCSECLAKLKNKRRRQ